jgi:hypothetical protein
MNALESSIMLGAIKAQIDYSKMTDGWWLSHGPESFLQIELARKIAKLGHAVYIDASIKKVRSDLGSRGRGRPSKNSTQRFDISVWHKADVSLRAAIEIKRAHAFESVKRDARRLVRYLRQKKSAKTAYILVYSEAKGKKARETLIRRFRNWAVRLSWKLVGARVTHPRGYDWAWGVAVLRHKNEV